MGDEMKKKLARYAFLICLTGGWISGILLFYLTDLANVKMPVYDTQGISFSDVCSAILTQQSFFIITCVFGFSMLSGIVPGALVFIRGALASFSCALVYNDLVSNGSFALRYAAFALTSALICVFLTSSARLSHIFYTKVPHTKIENILDYIARQLFTMGFATAVLIIYFAVCAIV